MNLCNNVLYILSSNDNINNEEKQELINIYNKGYNITYILTNYYSTNSFFCSKPPLIKHYEREYAKLLNYIKIFGK